MGRKQAFLVMELLLFFFFFPSYKMTLFLFSGGRVFPRGGLSQDVLWSAALGRGLRAWLASAVPWRRENHAGAHCQPPHGF